MDIIGDAAGYAAATLTTISFIPQAWRTFKTKDVSGISILMYSIFTLGVAMWLLYGLHLNDVPMMLANGITLSLALCILFMRVKYHPDRDSSR